MARILLVDDERSIRMTLRVFLTNAGHEVDLAEDAETALEQIQNHGYDVLITDIILPRMNGVDLVHAARQHDPRIQIIMITGEPSMETASAAVREGVVDYLTKPISRPAILKVVKQALRIRTIEEERHRLEQENQSHQEQLERRVAERTSELSQANEQLQRSIGRVQPSPETEAHQERLRVLGKMTFALIEDFGSLLTQAQAELYPLLKPHGLDDQELTLLGLRNLNALIRQSRQIIWKTLEFCHPDEILRKRSIPLAELLEEAAQSVRNGAIKPHPGQPESIRVRVDVPAGARVLGDPEQLRDALHQLVKNALEAMPKGGELTLEARSEGENIFLTVADTGRGMSEEVRRRCLAPFYTTKTNDDAGLGLFLVRNVITLHGGTVQVESRLNKGTRITLQLPRGESAA